jgi:hypothetical protein
MARKGLVAPAVAGGVVGVREQDADQALRTVERSLAKPRNK